MKKFTLLSIAMMTCFTAVHAADYVTAGNGTTYTLESLSAIPESGVSKAENIYTMANNVTITAGDKFEITGGVTVKMGDLLTLRIEGDANLAAESRTLFTRNTETDNPKGVYIASSLTSNKVQNIDFEYAGLKNFSDKGLDIDNCTFRLNNGKMTASGALSIGTDGACFTVTNCTFENNSVPAIGGGANFTNGITIDNCRFVDNNNKNANKPQVNLTVGGNNPVIIKNSTFVGAQRTKVGAIAVSNMMSLQGEHIVVIENNDIRGHRYGITTTGPLNATIKDNKIIDNKYETNAMNGGSGISVYDSTGQQTAVISGNRIEDNLWGITVIGGGNVNVGKTEDKDAADYNPGGNIFKNNGNNGQLYDLYNNTKLTVYAQGNQWNVDEQTAENIETVIFHKADDSNKGEVIYMPAMGQGSVDENISETSVRYSDGTVFLTEAGKVQAFTPSGTLAADVDAPERIADLSSLPQGIYILRVFTAQGISSIKIIK